MAGFASDEPAMAENAVLSVDSGDTSSCVPGVGPSPHYREHRGTSSAKALLRKAVRAIQAAGIGKSKRKFPIRAALRRLGRLDGEERRRQSGKESPYQTRGVLEASSHRVRRERNGCY